MEDRPTQYLNAYLNQLSVKRLRTYTSFSAGYFCSDEHNANVCAELIFNDEKRASCGMEYWYTHKGETRPQVGHLHVVTDWSGTPTCIIEITSVTTCSYNQISSEFAAAEGEGDKSLTWWREAHWDFFSRECNELGIDMHEDIPLMLEHFHVVYRDQYQDTANKRCGN